MSFSLFVPERGASAGVSAFIGPIVHDLFSSSFHQHKHHTTLRADIRKVSALIGVKGKPMSDVCLGCRFALCLKWSSGAASQLSNVWYIDMAINSIKVKWGNTSLCLNMLIAMMSARCFR
jgi:hypothetical protein